MDILLGPRLMAESHAGMRNGFEITHPAVDTLVELVHKIIGECKGIDDRYLTVNSSKF